MAVKSTHLYVTAELSYIIRTKLDRHIHSLMMQFKILPALALMAATVSAGLQPGFEPALEDTLKDDAHLRVSATRWLFWQSIKIFSLYFGVYFVLLTLLHLYYQ